MSVIETGKIFILIVFAIYWIVKFASHYLVDQGKISTAVARIPAFDAIDELIDRCVEMGRPAFYTLGDWAMLMGRDAPATVAGLNVLRYVAKQTAEKNVPLYVGLSIGQTYPITVDAVREAYASVNRLNAFELDHILYWSDLWSAFITGEFHTMDKEKPAAYMNIGIAADSSTNVPGYSRVQGYDMMSIGGCDDRTQIPPMIYGCDFWLVSEELFAAGQYASGEKEAGGGMVASDIFKLLIIALLVIGAIGALLGTNLISELLKI